MRTFKKALSISLCFVMLFTTFCFFPLTGATVEADAAAGITSEGSRAAFYAPEVIYLYPNVTSWNEATATPFQYYVSNAVDTSDIYKAPVVTAETSEKGVIYFASEEGMSDINLSYTFQTATGAGMEGGSVEYTVTEKGGYYEITIDDGTSPYIPATEEGCYIVWNLQFTTNKGERKAVFAVSYIYKPFVVPYGAVARVYNNSGVVNVNNENITWVTGVHSIDTSASANAGLYPLYKTVAQSDSASGFAFSPFLSKGSKAYVGNRAITGQAPVENGGYKAVFSAASSDIAYFYAGQTNAPVTDYISSEKWFTPYGTTDGAQKTDIYPYAVFDFENSENVKVTHATSMVTPTRLGHITIDTSRYSNLNEIPNLAVGFMITNTKIQDGGSISAGGAAKGKWVIGNVPSDYVDVPSQASGEAAFQQKVLASMGDTFVNETVDSFPVANGIKYAGAWNKEISKNEATKKYTVKSIVQVNDIGEYEYTVTASAVGLNATHVDKTSLRAAVAEASQYLGALGTKRNGMSLYFSATDGVWLQFANSYMDAYKALTRLGATAEEITAAEDALEAALGALLSGKSMKVLFDVNHDGIRPNLLAIADPVSVESFSLIYNESADSYTFNGTISKTARPYVSDVSLGEGDYTVSAIHQGGTRTVAAGASSSVALEFFSGENQLDPRVSQDMWGNGINHTFSVNAASADAINNFRFWFWVNGDFNNAVTFGNYTYQFKLEEGGTATAYSPSAKIVDGTTYGKLPAPKRDGFTFGGWYADKAFTTEITADSSISARVLYAKWIPNVYSVSFDNIFSLHEWATVGNAIRTASAASSGNNATYNSETNSVTIVSEPIAGECYTIYNSDCYSVKVQPDTSYRFSYKVSDRNSVGKTIVFAFLYDAAGNAIGFKDNDNYASKSLTVAENGEYYIDFTTGADADIFRCRFGTYSGDDGDVSVEATFSDVKLVENNAYNNTLEISEPEKTYDFGTTYGELAEATREGYVFDGWYTGKNGTGEKVTADTAVKSSNIILYSNWTANTYKVNLLTNGADWGSDKEITDCVYDVDFTLPAIDWQRTGYTFAGWSKTPDGEVLYTDKQTVRNVTADVNGEVNLYAVWAPNKFNVQFDANTGTGTMAPVQVAYESGAALPECGFTKTGYSFVGWALSGSGNIITQNQFNTLTIVPGETVTLYAIWSENSYSVTFDANGGTGNSTTQEYLYSVPFTLPANAFTRTGYVLSGWAASPDGAKLYDAGQRVEGLSVDKNGTITLYAVWSPVTYKIRFVGTPGAGSMEAITATYDVETVLPAATFTRTGYHFIGWATVQGGEVVYEAGDKALNLASAQNAEATLYAVWELNSYDVVLKFRGADGVMTEKTVSVKHGEKIENSDIEGFVLYPRSTGTEHFVFSGWNRSLENVTEGFTATASYGRIEDCTLSTSTTPSTCSVKGETVVSCDYCSYKSVTELSLAAHQYGEGVVTLDATCLTDGEKTFTCTVCDETAEGHVKTEAVKAAGHTFEDRADKNSTCAEQGHIAHRYCTVCENAFSTTADIWTAYNKAIDPMKAEVPHTPGTPASCTTPQICTVCENVLVPALGHKFTETYEASTKVDCSTTKGNYTIVRTCSVCSTVEREEVVNDFLPHSFRVEVIAPDCTEKGYDLYICTVCAHEEIDPDSYVAELGHDTEGVEWTVETEPTCTEDGLKVLICKVCHKPAQSLPIDSLGHTSGDWVITKEPTCTEKGVNSHYCTVCEEAYETEAIPTVKHTYQWTTVTEADCTTDGIRHNKCTVCGAVSGTEKIPMLGHQKSGDATCEKDSYCLRCDTVLKEKLGHDWNNGVITKDPTETEQGEREYTCLRDPAHKKYETIPVRIVIVLPEIPADGTYDLDASETGYLGNIHDIISVEAGVAYTVSVDNLNVLTINDNGYMMAVKDGNAVITITTNDGKYQKHLPVAVRTYKTITFDVNGVISTTKAYVGEKFTTITVESFEDEYGYIRSFKAWLLDGKAITDFTCTGDMYLTAQFTSSCDYSRFDRMAIVFEGLIGGYYDNADLITLNKQEVENAKALIAEFRADRNIRDSAEQGRVDAAANQISITVAKIYPEDNASIEIRGATECKAGTYADVKAYLMPLGLELADGVWTSSDNSIGFFTNGRFFAVRTGTVTLTVSRGNLSASVEINVTATTGARVIFFDSLITNANYILEGGYVIKETTNLFWATDAEVKFRVVTDGTFEEYTVYINDKKVEPDITGTYTIPANTGDAHVRIDGMVPDYSEGDSTNTEKISIWELIRNFFRKIGDFFRNLFGM